MGKNILFIKKCQVSGMFKEFERKREISRN